jgi:ankyrin repeat protein
VGTVKAAPIHDAAKNGDLAYVRLELEKGVDVNLKNLKSMQETPLHFAAEGGQKEVAEYLISKGANVNAISSFGHMRIPTTPLDKAKEEPWDSEETKAKKRK